MGDLPLEYKQTTNGNFKLLNACIKAVHIQSVFITYVILYLSD